MAYALISCACGIAIGRYFLPLDKYERYSAIQKISLTDAQGVELGTIPSATILISREPLMPNGEYGWWGAVPVYFGTSSEAEKLVGAVDSRGDIFNTLTINALPSSEVKYPLSKE